MKECYTGFTVQVNMKETIQASKEEEEKKDLPIIVPITVFTPEHPLCKNVNMFIHFDEELMKYLDYKTMDSFTNAIRQGKRRWKLLEKHYSTQGGEFYVTLHGLQKFVRNAEKENKKNLPELLSSLTIAIEDYLEKLRIYWVDRII